MKVTLTKNIKLYSATVYLRFRKQEERKDIKEYLNGKKHFEPLIENRIKDYLKNIGVFYENYHLTQLGYKVKETGKMYVSEEGKYQIWFTQNDSFFKNVIFYFRRLQPNAKDEIRSQIFLDKEGHFLLPTDKNKYTKLYLVSNQVYGNTNSSHEQIHFSWIWENLEKSYYVFTGHLGKSETQTKINSEQISSEIDIKKIIKDILPDWNDQLNRYAIRLNDLTDEILNAFEHKNYSTKWNDFDVQFQNLPIMPYDKEEARRWRNWLLNKELEKEYFASADFEQKVREINEKEALAHFDLDIPDINNFITKTTSPNGFWHLQAPLDLNPNAKFKFLSKHQHIELKQGEKISFKQIVSKLKIENTTICLYYDRYVINEKQHKAVAALFKSINSQKKIVITDLTPKPNSSDYIQKNAKEITIRDCKTIFNNKFPHDRYLIAVNQNEMEVWNISNSIDFITFNEHSITENTVGTIRQSVVFTPISKEMLDKDLLSFINKEIKNGN